VRRHQARDFAFRVSRATLYNVVVPVALRLGPLEPLGRKALWAIVRQPPFVADLVSPLQVDGRTLFFDHTRPSSMVRALSRADFEKTLVELVRAHLRSGMNVMDVGAHIGYHTLLFASLVGPSGRVFAFEPDEGNRMFLEQNVRANGFAGVTEIDPHALGAVSGEAALYRLKSDAGASTLFSPTVAVADTLVVAMTTIDAWAQRHGWPSIDFIKMDIEGAEPAALRGMTELSRRNPRLMLAIEFNAPVIERAGEDPRALFSQLRGLGFTTFRVADYRRTFPLRSRRDEMLAMRRSRWLPLNLFCTKGRRH
jgi:FkbM family methyltransferase